MCDRRRTGAAAIGLVLQSPLSPRRYGPYGDFADVALDAAPGDDVPVPFEATYRHAVLVARDSR